MPGNTQLVVCENARGEKIRFPDENSPISIISFDGFGSMEFDVKTSQNSGQDGESWNNSTAEKRNLTITFDIQDDYRHQRDRLHSFFQPRSWGTVYYYETEGGEGRKARYQVESLQIADYGVSRTGTLSLICPDPKFYALGDQLTELAVWEGKITFPLRFPPQINAEGQSVTITSDASITDYDKIAITGATVETGTGTKSPDNPYTLAGTTTLTVSDGGNQSQTITLPQTLYSLPNGVHDTYDVISGTGTQKVGKTVLNGTEGSWRLLGTYTNTIRIDCDLLGSARVDTNKMICDKFNSLYADTSDTEHVRNGNSQYPDTFIFYILKSHLPGWSDSWTDAQKVTAFKSWLSENPVTMLYQLATPKAISGEARTVPIYHPTTTLSLDAGTLSLHCRGKFVVTEKVNSLIGDVINSSAAPMGLTVTFRASGTVVNPSLYDVNRQQLMQINTTMHAGDVIIITTGDGNKRVKLISGGVTTNINNLMAYPPHWLQAQQGDNLYRYNADSGIDSLSVSILSTQAYWGA